MIVKGYVPVSEPSAASVSLPTRETVGTWSAEAGLTPEHPLFPDRVRGSAERKGRFGFPETDAQDRVLWVISRQANGAPAETAYPAVHRQ